jgi:fructose-1,6-bisphosphatase/inositol monophosphatase family enzyme
MSPKLRKLYRLYHIPGYLPKLDDTLLKELITIMVRAGSFALSMRELVELDVNIKGKEDYVTTVDLHNQDYLVGELLVANLQEALESPLPLKIGFVLEEDTDTSKSHAAKGDEDIFVYIDPIDGTTSYKDGGSNFCVGVSIESREGEVFYSAVYIPEREEIVVTSHAQQLPSVYQADGSKLELSKVTPSSTPTLARIAAHYNPAHQEKLLEVYSALAGKPVKWHTEVSPEERFGDNPVPGSLIIDLCDLARGKYDLVVNGGCHLWDIAPAYPVLKKLGYTIVDWSGKTLNIADFKGKDQTLTIVAGTPANIDHFFATLTEKGIALA